MNKTPSIEIFNEMKTIASSIWRDNYSDEYGYVSEKLDYINSFGNISDNAMVFYRMFDYPNQRKFQEMSTIPVIIYIEENV
jgi:hypothetical protein